MLSYEILYINDVFVLIKNAKSHATLFAEVKIMF